MKILKKIFAILFGLQLAGCASLDGDSELKSYFIEEHFKSEYNQARDYINKGLYSKALNILDKLDKECYPPASYTLYQLYDKAQGVSQDRQKAMLYLEKAFKYKYPLAHYDMAIKILEGSDGIKQNPKKAIEILEELGDKLKDGHSGEENIFYKLQAKTFVTLSKIYFENKYISQDLEKANEYGYIIGTLPTTQEDNIGRELLSQAYLLYGKIIEARKDKGLQTNWDSFVAFSNSIDMGNLEGYYQKGLVYLKKNNPQFAADTFGTGCYQGHAESCYEAGILYEKEKVYKNGDKDEWGKVRRNPMDYALDYYQKGAKLGSIKCKEKLKSIK